MERFFSGNKDADRIILDNLDDRDLLKACSVGKYALEICDETFFRNRLIKKYPNTLQYKNGKSWKKYYLDVIYYINKMKEDYDFEYRTGNPKIYLDILKFHGYVSQLFELIGKNSAKDLYELKAKKYGDNYDIYAITTAAENNQREFIEYLISKNNSTELLNWGLYGATKSNNIELINFFINKGAKDFNESLNLEMEILM